VTAQRKPYNPNNFCPCKSGQKYKKCCQPKNVEYFIRPNGTVVKEAVLEGDQRETFLRAKQDFVAEHGRQPTEEEEGILRMSGGFLDFSSVIEADLIKSGAPPEVLYAFRKTGILVTRENQSGVTPDELQRWENAILEYRSQSK
jgi:hypothetical protein